MYKIRYRLRYRISEVVEKRRPTAGDRSTARGVNLGGEVITTPFSKVGRFSTDLHLPLKRRLYTVYQPPVF